MHVDLIDRLRCVASHEDSWLVAAATETIDRHIIAGVLGCPVCSAEYAVAEGDVWYSSHRATMSAGLAERPVEVDADDAMRLAALLGIDERGGLYALQGTEGRFAVALETMGSVQVMLFDPPNGVWAPVIVRGAGERIPLAARSLRGIAIESAAAALVEAAARALAPQGRLVAPADASVPVGITVLARDASQWVGEADAPSSPPIALRRSTR